MLALAVAALFVPMLGQSPSRDQRVAALRQTFEQAAESAFSGAVLVAEGDDVLLNVACGLADRIHGRVNQPDTIFDIGSITKQFTAAAILLLEEQHKLATTDTLARFFERTPDDKKRIQLHHLLTHTSGLPTDVSVSSATTERDALVRAALGAKMQSKPGEEFAYNNVGYMLLGAIVEIASGESYESYVAEHLFAPAGMGSSGFLRTAGIDAARTARGYEARTAYGPAEQGWYSWGLRGCGGVLSTTGDLWLWSKALQTDAVLSQHSRDKLFKPFLLDYAYGWWVRDDPAFGRTIEHGGTTRGFEGQLTYYVERNLRVIVLCNDRGRSDALARELASAAIGKRTARSTVTLSTSDLETFAGKYEMTRGGSVTVRVDGDALVLEPDAKAVIALASGTADTTLADDARLKKRAEKVIDFLAAGDAEGAQTLMTTKYPGWNRQMVQVWKRWLDERGPLQRSECIGSLGSTATLVHLVHERRSVFWLMRWTDEVFAGWEINGQLPENAHYRARSASVFDYEESEGPVAEKYSLEFERDAAGKAQKLSLSSRSVHLSARRR